MRKNVMFFAIIVMMALPVSASTKKAVVSSIAANISRYLKLVDLEDQVRIIGVSANGDYVIGLPIGNGAAFDKLVRDRRHWSLDIGWDHHGLRSVRNRHIPSLQVTETVTSEGIRWVMDIDRYPPSWSKPWNLGRHLLEYVYHGVGRRILRLNARTSQAWISRQLDKWEHNEAALAKQRSANAQTTTLP